MTRPVPLLLLASALVTGCTVGPRYVEPETTLPERFDQDKEAVAEAQPVSTLWTAFGSAELDALIQRALAANTTIGQAAARLAETRALSGLSTYFLFPTVTAAADGERNQPSGLDPFIPPEEGRTETWRAGFDAVWEIDLFGSLRNQRRAIVKRVEADTAALAAAQLSIVAETAQAWFALLGARERLALLTQQVANLDENVAILRARLDAGSGTAFDLAQAEAQARSVAATIPDANAEVVRQEQRLGVLTAWPVEELRSHLNTATSFPPLPALVATGTPEQWMQRRPDVREAERRLAAANNDVGVEIAEYFPKLQLSGSFGWTAQSTGDLGSREAERWAYGPSLSWRFLDFGRVRQNVKAAEARVDGALALYQETVLRALEETENALAGFRAANQSAAELDLAVKAATEAASLARLRYSAGASDYLAVLDAERTLLDLEDRSVQAQTGRATALAAVHKALAGDP